MTAKQELTNNQIFNINFGYLGIQLAWSLQFANISGIFKFLGAAEHQIPLLWLAGPITGLIIPPLIGYISDFTWVSYLGRRRFYIFLGSLLAACALIAIPTTRNLTHAVLLVWLLDSGLNISMHPYRALIADKAPVHQQTKCFSLLTLVSGLGAAIAFVTPWMLAFLYIGDYDMRLHVLPPTIEIAFLMGAVCLLFSNLWTVISTTEVKSVLKNNNLEYGQKLQSKCTSSDSVKKSISTILSMPRVMVDLIKIELFTWMGMFTFIVYYALGIAQNIYGLPAVADVGINAQYSKLLQKGVELCGLHSCFYIIVSTAMALLLSRLSEYFARKNIYSLCLFLGSIGMIMTKFCTTNEQLIFCVLLIGLAWGAVCIIPFAILASGVPKDKVGWYMGYFNIFVVIPQIIVSCCFGYLLRVLFSDNAMSLISLGGCFMLIAAYYAYRVDDPYKKHVQANGRKYKAIATYTN